MEEDHLCHPDWQEMQVPALFWYCEEVVCKLIQLLIKIKDEEVSRGPEPV